MLEKAASFRSWQSLTAFQAEAPLTMKKKEPKLCPNCPLKHLVRGAKQRIRSRELLNSRSEISDFKLCMELRQMARDYGLTVRCPYFPKTETLTVWMGRKT